MKLLQKGLLVSVAMLLAGCNPVPSNCLELARSALKHSFEEAPKNNGLMITRVFIDPSYDMCQSNECIFKNKRNQYIVSISSTGEIWEGWWTFIKRQPDKLTTYYGLHPDPSVTKSPNVPEPEMKSRNGIVCKLGVHDNSEDWEGQTQGSIVGNSSEATLTQDTDGFTAKWQ